jgi:hypothetical protein
MVTSLHHNLLSRSYRGPRDDAGLVTGPIVVITRIPRWTTRMKLLTRILELRRSGHSGSLNARDTNFFLMKTPLPVGF